MIRSNDAHSQPQQSNGLYTHPNAHVRVDSGKPVAESWLNGQGVLVFGGATAAGAATVRALAEAGAYVTIADSNANEGQRLMLELVGRNLRVQYTFTNLPAFRSQTEAIHYASVFSPTSTLSVIICAAIPPPPPSHGPSLSILHWLRTTTADSTFPNPLPPPSTAPLDRAVTATYHAVHLALHHFRQSPPLIPQQQQSNGLLQHHHDPSSTSSKSASGTHSSPPSRPANQSPTSFKTAGTSTSAHAAPPVPSQPAPALPLDPSTALHAHPVVSREDGETSTSPKCPTTPGSLPAPGMPAPLSAAEMILPSPESPAGRALEALLQTRNPTAGLLPSERKHLVVVAPARFLSEDDDDEETDADSYADGALGRGRRALHALPPHHLSERAAAAGLRAMFAALEELCETDAVGPGINVGCVPWEEEDATNGHVEPKANTSPKPESADEASTADERCVRGVMRMLCCIDAKDRYGDGDAADDAAARAGMAGTSGEIFVTQDDALALMLDPREFEADPFADELTDVEDDADDEASASPLDEDDEDSSSSSTSHRKSLMLAARSAAPLDRPSPSASRSALPPALDQVREEEEDETGMSPIAPKGGELGAFAAGWHGADANAAKGVESGGGGGGENDRGRDGRHEDAEDDDGRGHVIGDDVLTAIGTAAAQLAPPLRAQDDKHDAAAQQQQQRRASSGSDYDERPKSADDKDKAAATGAAVDTLPKPQSQSQSQSPPPPQQQQPAPASTHASSETKHTQTHTLRPSSRLADNMKPLPAVPSGDVVSADQKHARTEVKEVEEVRGRPEKREEMVVRGRELKRSGSISSELSETF